MRQSDDEIDRAWPNRKYLIVVLVCYVV
jgi:hypothetical protein